MGRWLARLQSDEKNTKTARDETDKTDKTPPEPVLSVLSVPHPGKSENFEPDEIEREERLAVYGEPESTPAEPIRSDKQSGQLVHSLRVVADSFQSRAADWMPEPSDGIRILRPAVELSAIDYDKHLDKLIAALPAGSAEAQRLTFAKHKGWVVDCEGRRIYTRGRF